MSASDVIREGLKRLSDRDLDAWVELFVEDARLYELPEMPDADVFVGHDGLRQWATNLIEVSSEWSWELVEVLAQDEDLVVTATELKAQAISSDVPIGVLVFHVFEFEGNKIASVRAFVSREEAFAAAELEDA